MNIERRRSYHADLHGILHPDHNADGLGELSAGDRVDPTASMITANNRSPHLTLSESAAHLAVEGGL